MTQTEIVSLIGSGFIVGMSLLTFRVTLGHWFCQYGLQMLVAWATLGLCIAALRIADSANVLTPQETRTLASFVYVSAFSVMALIVGSHIVWHREAYGHGGKS